MVIRQYDICVNTDRTTRARFPYFVVLQSDLLGPLETVVVAPAVPERASVMISRLNPEVNISGKSYRVSMPDLAGVTRNRLGEVVGSVANRHSDFVAAIDLLFTGI